ncbi:recombinase RecT [Nocardia sp. NBC_01327]|uniref:recombinase RecT n=1 Tax=Nocardia sp. NBC_01327 TaxID=2903593 RepID=UPI002E10341E|nr:recombinase RecT [Nocardia sp. NBC_01327]
MGQNLGDRVRQQVAQRDTNAPDTTEDTRPKTIFQAIQAVQGQLTLALPKHLDAQRIARLALTAVRKNRDLAMCSPESFAGALLTSSALGLEPDVNGECYLVPFRDKGEWECQLIVGYQGYSKLFYQSPTGAHLDAHTVYEGDDFDYEYGTASFLRHKPTRGDRGDVIFYYATARLTTGSTHFVVLTPEEVKELRNGRVGPKGKIADPQRWMEKKTCIRQVLKPLPKSPLLGVAVTVDERDGRGLFRDRLIERQAQDDLGDVIDVPASDIDTGHADVPSAPEPGGEPA